jgi:membrane associated rhomboid family serine protease
MRELRVSGPRELTLDQCGRCGGVWFDHSEWDCLEALREWQHFRERDGRPTTWAEWFFQFLFNLPVEMNVRPQRPAYVTQAIIVACVAVFIVGLGDDLTPLFALTGDRALTLAGLPTFITHQFLHATPVHLLGNMYFLYVTGDNVEDVLGHVRFLCFYLLAGVLAGAAFLFITSPDPAFPLVGASGSISAVMAAYALLFRQAKLTVMVFFQQFRVPAWAWIGFWFAFNVLGAVTDPTGQRTHIAFIAHLMGFAVGIALVAPRRRRLIDGHPLLGLLASERLG